MMQKTMTTVVDPIVSALRRKRDLLQFPAHIAEELLNRIRKLLNMTPLRPQLEPCLPISATNLHLNPPSRILSLTHPLAAIGRGTRN